MTFSDRLSSKLSTQKINLVEKDLNKVSLQYTGIRCEELDTVVRNKNTESTFSMLKQNIKKKEIHDDESKCLREGLHRLFG